MFPILLFVFAFFGFGVRQTLSHIIRSKNHSTKEIKLTCIVYLLILSSGPYQRTWIRVINSISFSADVVVGLHVMNVEGLHLISDLLSGLSPHAPGPAHKNNCPKNPTSDFLKEYWHVSLLNVSLLNHT